MQLPAAGARPPGDDPFTAVLLRRHLPAGENISSAVRGPLLKILEEREKDLGEDLAKAWRTTCKRIAAVRLSSVPA